MLATRSILNRHAPLRRNIRCRGIILHIDRGTSNETKIKDQPTSSLQNSRKLSPLTKIELSRTDGKRDSKEILNRLYELAKPEKNLILASAATLGVTSSITLLLPYACGKVLDLAIIEASTATSSTAMTSPFTAAVGLFGLTATAGLGVYARSLMLNIAGNRIVQRMRQQLFKSILVQESAFFDFNKSGDLISRLSNDAQYIKGAVTTDAVSGLRGIVMSVGSTSLLFYTSPDLAVVSLLSIPPVFLAARTVGMKLRKEQKNVQEMHGKATSIAEEVFNGIKTVQQFVAEKYEYEKYLDAIGNAHCKEIHVGKTKAAFDGIVHVAANGAILLVLAYGGNLVIDGTMSAGELSGFLMYSLLMAGNVSSLSGTYTEMMKSIAAAGRVLDIIDRDPAIPRTMTDDITCTRLGSDSLSVHFHNVKFSYPSRNDVQILGPKFSLDIEAGEVISIVGGSGSGKSTIASLLTRIYDCDDGVISLNNNDITKIDPEILRNSIAIVPQEPQLFRGTIADNIRYGRFDASDEEVFEAAKLAHVLNFTDNLPHGLYTEVGDRGRLLSGGQRQRVALARAILKDAPIVILDEATSALDSTSEYHVHEAIKCMTKDKTVISIAHRLSTIKESDRIVVLQDGIVVESGTFEQLLDMRSVFYNLVEQQLTFQKEL